jgi:hypothetical protein
MTYKHTIAVAALAFALSITGRAIADDGGHDQNGHHDANQTDDHGNDITAVTPAPATGDQNDDKGHDGQNNNQNGASQDDQNKSHGAENANLNRLNVRLMATPAGTSIGASGDVDIRAQGQRQRIRVEVEANVNDGTMFDVSANGVSIGTIKVQFNEGELELNTDGGRMLPGGLFPADITAAKVTDMSGSVILEAQFAALRTAGSAPNMLPDDHRVQTSMTPTPAGLAIGAEGHADLREQGQRARLKLEVEASVADGTVFTVMANGIAVGKVTLNLGEGEFQLESQGAMLPTGISSIGAITSVQISAPDGAPILNTSF